MPKVSKKKVTNKKDNFRKCPESLPVVRPDNPKLQFLKYLEGYFQRCPDKTICSAKVKLHREKKRATSWERESEKDNTRQVWLPWPPLKLQGASPFCPTKVSKGVSWEMSNSQSECSGHNLFVCAWGGWCMIICRPQCPQGCCLFYKKCTIAFTRFLYSEQTHIWDGNMEQWNIITVVVKVLN